MDADDLALIFIGMPVFNEAEHICAALASIQAQSYANIRVLISDNASTDSTREKTLSAIADDPRFEYVCLAQNIGATANFQHMVEQAEGDYFMWAAGHHLWSANFLSEAVAAMRSDTTISIAFPTSTWVDH